MVDFVKWRKFYDLARWNIQFVNDRLTTGFN